MEPLQAIVDEMSHQQIPRLTEAPTMVDLSNLGRFLQDLRNQGMHPFLTGEFPTNVGDVDQNAKPSKPYLVR